MRKKRKDDGPVTMQPVTIGFMLRLYLLPYFVIYAFYRKNYEGELRPAAALAYTMFMSLPVYILLAGVLGGGVDLYGFVAVVVVFLAIANAILIVGDGNYKQYETALKEVTAPQVYSVCALYTGLVLACIAAASYF